MLKNISLPIKLWSEAAKTDIYIRNRTAVRPEVDGMRITPKETWTQTKPSIDHIRVWGCKCYFYVNPKSLPASERQDKLMDRERVTVFIKYENNITRQYRIYTPDLRYVTVSSVITFDESQQGGFIDLKMRFTSNILPNRNSWGRPRKEPIHLDFKPTSQPTL
jgi:head-tail adaptor